MEMFKYSPATAKIFVLSVLSNTHQLQPGYLFYLKKDQTNILAVAGEYLTIKIKQISWL
jgi:hypothetical protein